MGGSDDLININEVSVEEHSELHLALYLEYGRREDWIAYHMLAGKTTEGEASLNELRAEYMRNRVVGQRARDAMSEYNKVRIHSLSSRQKRSDKMSGENNPFYGKTHNEETRVKCSQGAKEQWKRKLVWINNGKVQRRVEENDIPEGFQRGRL